MLDIGSFDLDKVTSSDVSHGIRLLLFTFLILTENSGRSSNASGG